MKTKVLITTLLFFTCIKHASAKADTTLKKILHIDLNHYKQCPVDSFLAILPANYIKLTMQPRHRLYTNVLLVYYANDVRVWIEVKQFKYFHPGFDLNKPISQFNDSMRLFRKEAMAFAIIYKGEDCLKGCESDPYWPWILKDREEQKHKHRLQNFSIKN